MSTIAEIEAAVEQLPLHDQERLLDHLTARLRPQPSCYDLSKDILEALWQHGGSGQTDLSTNKKYMENFGLPRRPFTK